MAERADGVEAALEIGARADAARAVRRAARPAVPRPCARSERTRVSSISGWRMKSEERWAARGEQAQQHAARCGMFLKQREKRGARTDRRDERGEVHEREIGIGEAANLVEQSAGRGARAARGDGARPPRPHVPRRGPAAPDGPALSAGRAKPSSLEHQRRRLARIAAPRATRSRRRCGNRGLAALARRRASISRNCVGDQFAMIAELGLETSLGASSILAEAASARPATARPAASSGQGVGLQTRRQLAACARRRARKR